MGNPIAWVELCTHNLEGAKSFYEKLFEWKISSWPSPEMTYYTAETGGQTGAGMMGLPEPGVPTSWMMYVGVDNIEAACAKLNELGGKVWKGPFEVKDVGWIAIACDPQGAYFGLIQSAKPCCGS